MTAQPPVFKPALFSLTFRQSGHSRRFFIILLAAAAVIAATILYGSKPTNHRTAGFLAIPNRQASAVSFPFRLCCPGHETKNHTTAAPEATEAIEKPQLVAATGIATVAILKFILGSTTMERGSEDSYSSTTANRLVFATELGDLHRSVASVAPATMLASKILHAETYIANGYHLEKTTVEATVSTAADVRDMFSSSSTSPVITTTRPILYVRFFDALAGLGNKMFQYASGLGLALRYNAEPRLVADNPAISTLLVSMRSVFRMSPLPEQPAAPGPADVLTLTETGWGRYDSDRFDSRTNFERDTTVVGYLQSWRYFDPVKERIRREFALLPHVAIFADDFLGRSNDSRTTGEGSNGSRLFIGVHVRRGDMVSRSDLYTVAPSDFLLKAINHYVAKYARSHELTFVMATNDYEWVSNFLETRLPKHIRVLRLQFSPEKDMAVLSRCNHSIVTAGTFGWWSAWLAGGDVIYYKDFIRRESQLYEGHVPSDYYPPSWIGLD